MSIGQLMIALVHALVGWGLCGATMGIGLAKTSVSRALAIHAVAAPIIFGFLSMIYFSFFAYTTPLQTAAGFVAVIITLDFFVVGLLIQRDLAMFRSVLGTWLPFALIFLNHKSGTVWTDPQREALKAWVETGGTMVALHAAWMYPARASALVLVASSPRFVQSENWPYALDTEVLKAGHVGIMSGRSAGKHLWPMLADWLASRSSLDD